MSRTQKWVFVLSTFFLLILVVLTLQIAAYREQISALRETQQTELQTIGVMSQNIKGLLEMNQELTKRVERLESQINTSPTPSPLPQRPNGLQASFITP